MGFFISLSPRVRSAVTFQAFCLDFEKNNPSSAESFVVGSVPQQLEAVLERIRTYAESHPAEDITVAAQVAIWLAQDVDLGGIRPRFPFTRSDEVLARRFVG